MTDRITIVIVDRVQQWRWPNTKKRRIRNKWKRREENFRPMMVPVGLSIYMGSAAAASVGAEGAHSGPVPDYYEMSTDLWCMVAGLYPEFAERCDLFFKDIVVRDGISWEENVPMFQ